MTTGDEASPLEWRQLQEKAVSVLGDVLDWELPGPVWEKKVPGALSDMTRAATARDLPAFWRAIGALWLCEGTSRVQTRVGGPLLLPAPLGDVSVDHSDDCAHETTSFRSFMRRLRRSRRLPSA